MELSIFTHFGGGSGVLVEAAVIVQVEAAVTVAAKAVVKVETRVTYEVTVKVTVKASVEVTLEVTVTVTSLRGSCFRNGCSNDSGRAVQRGYTLHKVEGPGPKEGPAWARYLKKKRKKS